MKADTTEKVVEAKAVHNEDEDKSSEIENEKTEIEVGENEEGIKAQTKERTEVNDTVAVATAAKSHLENTVPPIVTINATAVIDNSPNNALTNEDVNSLVKILRNKEHLVNNIHRKH